MTSAYRPEPRRCVFPEFRFYRPRWGNLAVGVSLAVFWVTMIGNLLK
jgi:hypothetical protein